LTINANASRSNLFNTYSFSLQSNGVSAQIQTLGHLFPKLKSSMADQNQAAQVIHPFKTHSALFFSIPTSDFFFRHFLVGAFHRAFDSH
jgi:hypothetical protein